MIYVSLNHACHVRNTGNNIFTRSGFNVHRDMNVDGEESLGCQIQAKIWTLVCLG